MKSLARYKKKHSNPLLIVGILFALFAGLVYGPFVLKGGLIYDDWSVSGLSRACPNIVNSYSCFWGNYSDRPLAPLYYGSLSNLLNGWAAGYIILVTIFWLVGVWTVFIIFRKRFGPTFAVPFLFVAALPSISSTIIFSPAMQGIGAFTFMLWAFSLYLLDKYLISKSVRQLLGCFGLVFAIMLLYETSLPLFTLLMAWPFIVSKEYRKTDRKHLWAYARRFVLPFVLILLTVLIYQRLFIVHFATDVSKFRIGSNQDAINFGGRTLLNDVYIFTIAIVNFSARGLLRLLRNTSFLTMLNTFLAVIAGWWAIKGVTWKKKDEKIIAPIGILAVVLVFILLGIAALHFVAVSPPTIVGYLNRGLVSGSIVLAIAAGLVWQKWSKNTIIVILWGIFFVGYLSSFILQRNNFIRVNAEQRSIGAKAVAKLETTNQDSMFVLAEVPTYLPSNFNNETVFSDEVLDWGNYLHTRAKNPTTGGISLSTTRLERGELEVQPGKLRVMKSFDVDIKRIWYYDVRGNKLTQVNTEEELRAILNRVKNNPTQYPLSVDAQARNTLRDWLFSY